MKENINSMVATKEAIKAILETDSTEVFKSLLNKKMHHKWEIASIIEDTGVGFFLGKWTYQLLAH